MGSIYLIRHGQASLGAEDYDVLSPVGIKQSKLLGEYLNKLNVRFDRCYAGNMKRQIDTCHHALAQMADAPTREISIDTGFNEYRSDEVMHTYLPRILETQPDAKHFVENAGQHRKEFQKVFSQVITSWITDENCPADCQSWPQFVAGVRDGLKRVMEEAERGQTIAIFTSGGMITAAVQLITGMPATSAFELNWQIVNTSVSRLQYRRDKLSLASFNSQAHLDVHQRSEWVTYR
ncbi:Broad specificity phosphatase PhoE [Halopseudomonas xinjiangensis]|uniref:Broad specificity phosphatase PhoE n=1 Tax=Halopseudomonas xinjiangensis TaxID=487184 RepID=A0A1H1RUT0_9GAMM|nr:histidine phosphatase family protein [Halopseudomonas xinjiangensis]SDS39405.1 Broad specificity phosphatase PhoE [Halopseudomonas xinjiangensis]